MKRKILLIIGLMALLSGCITQPEGPSNIKTNSSGGGITFIYTVQEGDLVYNYSTVFVGRATLSGVDCDLFENSKGKKTCMSRGNDTLNVIWEQHQGEERSYEPPIVYVRPPLTVGEEWNDDLYSHRVIEMENVTTGAGTFETFKIVHATKGLSHELGGSGTQEYTWWWSPDLQTFVKFESSSSKMMLEEVRRP